MWMVLLACATEPAGPCDDDALRKVSRALQLVSGGDRVALAAQGIGETCILPLAVHAGLSGLWQAPPEFSSRAVLEAVADDAPAFEAACPGGLSVMAGAASLPVAARSQAIAAHCKPDFLRAGDGAAGSGLPLAILVRAHMSGNDPALRMTVLRALSGL